MNSPETRCCRGRMDLRGCCQDPNERRARVKRGGAKPAKDRNEQRRGLSFRKSKGPGPRRADRLPKSVAFRLGIVRSARCVFGVERRPTDQRVSEQNRLFCVQVQMAAVGRGGAGVGRFVERVQRRGERRQRRGSRVTARRRTLRILVRWAEKGETANYERVRLTQEVLETGSRATHGRSGGRRETKNVAGARLIWRACDWRRVTSLLTTETGA